MTAQKRIRVAIIAIIGLLVSSCDTTPSYEENWANEDEYSSYLKKNIDNYNVSTRVALDEELATIPISTKSEEIQRYREGVWDLWKGAMKDEMTRLGFAPEPTNDKEVIIDIPQDQRLKMRFLTKGERPESGYPLFINLHGGGQDPTVMGPWGSLMNEREWQAALTLGARYEDAPSLYVVPRMADDRIGRWYLLPQREAYYRLTRAAMASELVDPHRLYLIGISEGGYGTHRMSFFMPDAFTAFGPMAAAEPMADYIMNLRNATLRMEVGENDTAYDRNINAVAWKEALEAQQAENPGLFRGMVIIQEGRGHGINYFDVAPWVAQQTERVTYPDHITYEFHNLEGFPLRLYYLDLFDLTFPEIQARPVLEVKHEGNRYDIQLTGENTPVGTLRLYLDEHQVDLSRPITVTLNGEVKHQEKVQPTMGALLESMTCFGDPLRIFPAYIDLAL
ncbi:MAG: hypothetical protein Q4D93_00670 [Porphyromonas sp.]|nr:hypothetical protein [Porphyromonas sp.]